MSADAENAELCTPAFRLLFFMTAYPKSCTSLLWNVRNRLMPFRITGRFWSVVWVVALLLGHSSCKQKPEEPVLADAEAGMATPEITRLSEKILAEPGRAEWYFLRGQEFRAFNNQAALEDFKRAWQIDSTRPEHALGLAEQFFIMNDSRSSMGVLSRWIKLHPGNTEVLWVFARQAMLLRQYDASLGALNQILRSDRYNAEAYYLKGRNYRFLGDTAEAVSSYQTALEMDPALERAHLELGALLLAGGDDKGLRYLNNALALNDSSSAARYQMAKYHQDRGEFGDAVAVYQELINRDPQNGDALYNLATIWYAADSVSKAYRLFDLVTKVEPARSMGFYGKGLCAVELGRIEEAQGLLRNALQLNAEFEAARHLLDSLETLSR